MTQYQHPHAAEPGTVRIGGTDASTIMNANKFSNRNALWRVKTGRDERPDLSNIESVKWGNILETPILQELLKQLELPFHESHQQAWLEDGWRVGYVDYRISPDHIIEIKTTGSWAESEWDDGVPPYYYWQLVHYMLIDPRITHATVACLIGGQKLVTHTVHRDEYDILALKAAEDEFYRMVIDDIEPEIMVRPGELKTFDMEDDVAELCARYLETSRTAKVMNNEVDRLKNALAALIGENNEQVGQHYTASYKWVAQKRLDADALLQDSGLDKKDYMKEGGYYRLNLKEQK